MAHLSDESSEPPSRRPRRWRLVPIAVIGLGIVLFFALGGHKILSFDTLSAHRQELLAWSEGHTVLAVASYMVLYTIVVALSLPGAIWMTIAGGFLFGPVAGTLYTVIAATVGATAIFLAARYALGDALRAKAKPALKRMEAGFREDAMSYLFVLRLVPLFPFWLVNLAPAFLGVSLRTYLIATFFGISPGTLVFILVGNGLGSVLDAGGRPDLDIIFEPEILAAFIGLAVIALIPVAYKRLRRRLGLPGQPGNAAGQNSE